MGAFLSIDEYRYHGANSTLWGWGGQNPVRWRDPFGRDIYASDAASQMALDRLRSDPILGPEIRELDADHMVQVEIGHDPTANGGYTSWSENPSDLSLTFIVGWDLASAQNANGLSYDLNQLLAHELGHVWDDSASDGPPMGGESVAFEWENTQRGEGPFAPNASFASPESCHP